MEKVFQIKLSFVWRKNFGFVFVYNGSGKYNFLHVWIKWKEHKVQTNLKAIYAKVLISSIFFLKELM